MTKMIQLDNISKNELYEHLENLIDKKLAPFTAKNKDEKLSIKEVAQELGVVDLTIHNYIKKGILPAFKIGRRVFINRSDIDQALKEVKSLKYKR
ncbi:helix-turn-helix domain-containing protein [Psychroserpens luteus]|uniref:Helix-turn-helix domain-containing protein n=1 Tax=Psychroserpens luteus TaxID=1434066 RepID=A0ABW5ZS35_9FLAO|nr:helix-turn-helix domain-containing protein [Psychroserpens luteus]